MEGLERIIGMIIDGESSEYLDVPIWKKTSSSARVLK